MSDNRLHSNNNDELKNSTENEEEFDKKRKMKKKNDIISVSVGILAIIGIIVSSILKHK